MAGLEDAGSPTNSLLELEEVPPDARLSPRNRREPFAVRPYGAEGHPVDRPETRRDQRLLRAGRGVEVEFEEPPALGGVRLMRPIGRGGNLVQEVVARVSKDSPEEAGPRGGLEEIRCRSHGRGDVEDQEPSGPGHASEFREQPCAVARREPEDVSEGDRRPERAILERLVLPCRSDASQPGGPRTDRLASAERPEHGQAQVDRNHTGA